MASHSPQPTRRPPEQGGVLIFFVFVIIAAVALLGLVVDVGRLLMMQRQLQNAADAGSLSGVLLLRPGYSTTDWTQSRLSVLAIVKTAVLNGLDSTAGAALHSTPETFRLDGPANPPACYATANDVPGYRFECGNRGNLTIRVSRGIWCFHQVGTKWTRRWCSVEEKSGPGPNDAHALWQQANSMRVNIDLSNIETTFARIFLIDRINRVGAESISELGPVPALCPGTTCTAYGIDPDDATRPGGACE